MGGSKKYLSDGGFAEQTFRAVGTTSNGIKILEEIGNDSAKLPLHSNTPYTMYASRDSATGELKQISVYGGADGRTKIKDLDWGHKHPKPDGTFFQKGTLHVQEYSGTIRTSNKARKPSRKEKRIVALARYGRKL